MSFGADFARCQSTLPALRSEVGHCSQLCSMPASAQPNLSTLLVAGENRPIAGSGTPVERDGWEESEQPALRLPATAANVKQRPHRVRPYARLPSADTGPPPSPPSSVGDDGDAVRQLQRRARDSPAMQVASGRQVSQSSDAISPPSSTSIAGWFDWATVKRSCSPAASAAAAAASWSAAQPIAAAGASGTRSTARQRKRRCSAAGSSANLRPECEATASMDELAALGALAGDTNITRQPPFVEDWLNIQAMVDCILLMVERVQQSVTLLQARDNEKQQQQHASGIPTRGQISGQATTSQVDVDSRHAPSGCSTSAPRPDQETSRRSSSTSCGGGRGSSSGGRSYSSGGSGSRSRRSTVGGQLDIALDAHPCRRSCHSSSDDQDPKALHSSDAETSGQRTSEQPPAAAAALPRRQASRDNPKQSASESTRAAKLQRKGSCWSCGRRTDKMCSNCCRARYCSAFCQQKDWPSHSITCLATTKATEATARASC